MEPTQNYNKSARLMILGDTAYGLLLQYGQQFVREGYFITEVFDHVAPTMGNVLNRRMIVDAIRAHLEPNRLVEYQNRAGNLYIRGVLPETRVIH